MRHTSSVVTPSRPGTLYARVVAAPEIVEHLLVAARVLSAVRSAALRVMRAASVQRFTGLHDCHLVLKGHQTENVSRASGTVTIHSDWTGRHLSHGSYLRSLTFQTCQPCQKQRHRERRCSLTQTIRDFDFNTVTYSLLLLLLLLLPLLLLQFFFSCFLCSS